MRALLVEWLSAEGYPVHAYNHLEALKDAEADLVIVDVFMPRHGGCAKLRSLQGARPATPMIAISGQFLTGPNGASTTARELGVRRVIGKPFTREHLLRAVRDVIGSARD